MKINIPVKDNEKLATVIRNCGENAELEQLLKCCNVTAINRLGYSDHGPTHVMVSANIALKVFRILASSGVKPSIVKDYSAEGFDAKDAEVVVVLGTLLHDIGMSVHRGHHERYGVAIADRIIPSLLSGVYDGNRLVIVKSEILHCIAAHEQDPALTIEAGAVKVGDALNMTEGRAKIPFEGGKLNIHTVSAQAISGIDLKESKGPKPVKVEIFMSNSAGIFQVDELLRAKIATSGIRDYLSIVARVSGTEKNIVKEIDL